MSLKKSGDFSYDSSKEFLSKDCHQIMLVILLVVRKKENIKTLEKVSLPCLINDLFMSTDIKKPKI